MIHLKGCYKKYANLLKFLTQIEIDCAILLLQIKKQERKNVGKH